MAAHEWVEAHIGRDTPLSDFQRSAIDLLCAGLSTGPWNVPIKWGRVDWVHGRGVRFVFGAGNGLSTFDFDHLTRLVVLAHDRCIRVTVEPSTFRHIAVTMFPRDLTGPLHARHPTLEEAASRLRLRHPPHRADADANITHTWGVSLSGVHRADRVVARRTTWTWGCVWDFALGRLGLDRFRASPF